MVWQESCLSHWSDREGVVDHFSKIAWEKTLIVTTAEFTTIIQKLYIIIDPVDNQYDSRDYVVVKV